MAQVAIGLYPLFVQMPVSFSASLTARNISAATHWVGGQFIAPVTGTIDTIRFRTSTVASPLFQLEAAITNFSSSPYPTGSDVAVSSTTATNPTSSTDYALTISASVTAGTLYGIIVRVKSGTYTSGSANVLSSAVGMLMWSSNFYETPTSSHNIGSNAVTYELTAIAAKYSTGYELMIGLTTPSTTTTVATGTASGNVCGNKFTLLTAAKVGGYILHGDLNGSVNVEMYSGSDNTAISGSSITPTLATDATGGNGARFYLLGAPLFLNQGTYRVGIRNTSTTSNILYEGIMPESGMGAMLAGPQGAGFQRTVYASGAWTDTGTRIAAITPIISAVDDGRPWAQSQVGF
jgi:hypothetical protein